MATFSKATFNSARYASIRPTYPRQLYDFVFKYHERGQKARWGTAVDLGCGTGEYFAESIRHTLTQYAFVGQATTELSPFQKIIGVDPSAKMIEQATKNAATTGLPGQIEYKQSAAEELPFLEDGSVDFVSAGSCLHLGTWLIQL